MMRSGGGTLAQRNNSRFQEHAAGMRVMGEAMQLISVPEKQAFLQACQQCPELIQRESSPMLFLLRADFNSWAAAARLAKYWDMRYQAFGPDRAFLPVLDLSGNGALPPFSVNYVATGVGTILPPDDQGRPVLFIDRSRLTDDFARADNEVRWHVCCYTLTKLMLLAPNFVAVLFLTTKPRFYPGAGSWFSDALLKAFPVKMDAAYVICRSPRSTFRSFVATFLPVITRLTRNSYSQFNVTFDIGDMDDLRKKLIQKGMHPETIPEAVGGTWSYEIFEDWMINERNETPPLPSMPRKSILTGHISKLNQDSSNGLELLAAVVEQEQMGKVPADTKQHEDEMVVGQGSPNLLTGVKTSMMVSTDHPNIATLGGTNFELFPMVPAQVTDGPSSQTLPAVEQALASIPAQEKSCYYEAIRCAPDIVRKEADLATFLSLEYGNAQRAAKRVVSYWNMRTAIFKERAFLPLHQSDDALNTEDLRTLKCGYITLLPNDMKGRSIICCDASRLENDYVDESRLRCFIYMLHVASENASSNDGVSILLVMNKLSFERTREHSSLPQLLKVFPVKVAGVHIVRQPARLGARFFEDKVVPTLVSLFRPLINVPLQKHSGTPSCELLKELAQSGFDADNLPRSLGGGWTYQHFLYWREQRLIVEGTASLNLNPKISHGAGSGHSQYEMPAAAALLPLGLSLTPAQLPVFNSNVLQPAPGGSAQRNPFVGNPSHLDQQQLLQLFEVHRLRQQVAGSAVPLDDIRTIELLQRARMDAATIGNLQLPAQAAEALINRLVASAHGPAGSSRVGAKQQQAEIDPMYSLRAASATEATTAKQNQRQQQTGPGNFSNQIRAALYLDSFSRK